MKAPITVYAYLLREATLLATATTVNPPERRDAHLEVLKKGCYGYLLCCNTTSDSIGAGGLVRAYGKIVPSHGTSKTRIVTYAAKLELSLSYSLYGRIPGILASFGAITEREIFEEDVKVTVFVPIQNHQALKDALIDRCHGQIVIKDMQNLWADFS